MFTSKLYFVFQFRAESDKKSQDQQTAIKKLEDEKSDLTTQLEDAQFRAEEESINKSDIEVCNYYLLIILGFIIIWTH